MTLQRLIAVLLVAVCLSVGWIAGTSELTVQAQTPPLPTPLPTQPSVVQIEDCHFDVFDPSGNAEFLLDQCTGDTWRYDDGYVYGQGQVRPPSWVRLGRN